jgi:succinoglycan biosynthesis transport protein ExoP
MSKEPKHQDAILQDEYDYAPAAGKRQRGMQDYLHWILRRLWLIILTTVVGLILGIYVFNRTPDTYSSVAKIQVERQEMGVNTDENDQEMRMSGQAWLNTMAQKFMLPKYFRLLAETQSLHERPDILPEEFSFFGSSEDNIPAAITPAGLAGAMQWWVKVFPAKDSNFLQITVSHTNPEITQIVANGLIEAYKLGTSEEMAESSGKTVESLSTDMETLRELIGKLSKRKARYSDCTRTKSLIDEADFKIAEMKTRYGPKWDPFVKAKTSREALKQKFLTELEVVQKLDEDEKAYWAHEDRKDADPVDELQPRVTLIENEMRTAEQRLVSMQETMSQAKIDITSPDEFSIAQPAEVGYKVGPKKIPMIAKFAGGGLFCGLGIVMLLGFLDPSARTVADIEGMFDVPVLGAIPLNVEQKKSKKGGRRSVTEILTDHSPPAEAIRNLRAGLSFLGSQEDRRSFLFTSSLPSEGKSWVSANLAVAFGAQGDKTLVIDLDLRKPVMHKTFNMDRTPGFSDFISQKTPLKEIFHKTEHKNVYLITAGTQSPNPSELLTAKNLKTLMSRIPKGIDRIIIDTAPVLAVRDALAPAKLVDSTIVVFKMAKTPSKALDRLIRVLSENGTAPVGIVANGLPKSRGKGYGYYGDYYYGYHGSSEYYGEKEEND